MLLTEAGIHDQDQDDLVRLNQSRDSAIRSNGGGRTLEITVIEGKLYRNTEDFGAMDPFISLKYKMQEYKSKALDGAGKTPKWNETLTIPIDSIDDIITISCIDDDGDSKFEIVGAETFKISLLLTKTASGPAQFVLNHENKKSADILMSAKLGTSAYKMSKFAK